MNELAEFLQNYGGWGVSVFFAVMWMRDRKQFGTLLEDRHKEFVGVIREDAAVMTTLDESIKRCESVLNRVEGKL